MSLRRHDRKSRTGQGLLKVSLIKQSGKVVFRGLEVLMVSRTLVLKESMRFADGKDEFSKLSHLVNLKSEVEATFGRGLLARCGLLNLSNVLFFQPKKKIKLLMP